MAYFGLRYPVIAKYDRSSGTYSDGFVCGKAVSLEVTPNYSEGSLYGDDEQAEYEKAFTNAKRLRSASSTDFLSVRSTAPST